MMRHVGWTLAVVMVASHAFASEELAAVGQKAPMFRLPTYNSKVAGMSAVGLQDWVGPDAKDKSAKVVLLSFMASFCAPCKKEMPYLQTLQQKYGGKGLKVLMISIDTEEKGYEVINELIEKNKVTFPVLKDRFNLVARRWLGTQSPLPSVFLVDAEGVVKLAHRGYSEESSQLLDREVARAMGMSGEPKK